MMTVPANRIAKLHLYDAHAEASPTILFLHGSPLSGRMWLPQFEFLPEFHCLAPDLPEHGRSAAIRPFEINDAVRRLVELIREASPSGRAHVVGLSFGGVVAQALMIHAPDVVDHVILSGTTTGLGKGLYALLKFQLVLNRLIVPCIPTKQLSHLCRWQLGVPTKFNAMFEEDVRKVTPSALMRLVAATYSDIITPRESRSPVLVVVGETETWIAKRMAHRPKSTISRSKAVMVPKVGHVWNLQSPQLFAEMVRAWVTDRPLPDELVAM
jgi:pimeloyl-ACP methyl ester carboxylesterase